MPNDIEFASSNPMSNYEEVSDEIRIRRPLNVESFQPHSQMTDFDHIYEEGDVYEWGVTDYMNPNDDTSNEYHEYVRPMVPTSDIY